MGAQMAREVASKTSDIAGDGTTTATVLAQAAGANPMEIKRGIERAVEVVTAELKKMSKPVSGKMVAQVGTISANDDEAIGTIIAEAMEKVGKDGVITVEEAKTMDTSLEIVEGMQFDCGYLSAYFVTGPARMEVVLEDPHILIHDAFRLFVRGVIQHGDGFTPAETTSYLNAAQAQTFTQTLVALGVVAADGGDRYHLVRRAASFGGTLEWYVARELHRWLGFDVATGVKFHARGVGGDFDLVLAGEGSRSTLSSSRRRQSI